MCRYTEEARDRRGWRRRAAAGRPEEIEIMYGLSGQRRLTEWLPGWLPGCASPVPADTGNAGPTRPAVRSAIRDAEQEGLDAPLGRRRVMRDDIRRTVGEQAIDPARNRLAQGFGAPAMDAGLPAAECGPQGRRRGAVPQNCPHPASVGTAPTLDGLHLQRRKGGTGHRQPP